MFISGINSQISNNSIGFGSRTRSQREAEREKSYTKMVNVCMPEEDLQLLEMAKKNAEKKRREQAEKEQEANQQKSVDKQYREDVKELKETKSMINDITQNRNLNSGLLKNVGKAADILITATLSGMALHWSTGKAFMMIRGFCKKPKVSKFIDNVKRPFEIVGSGLAEGAKTAWNTMATKVKATKNGKKFVNSKPVKAINEGLKDMSQSFKNFKTDVKNLKTEDIKSGISTVFGVSGFGAAVVEKLDGKPQEARG